ncbi:hypothetical protein SH1V18_15990 [Vallitalea longa]|uniref:Uncharacterized protein n=1 Tax=Vallitalea longa TaxID=2936439 RepID=A0A9W6DFV9_9FIRM|nr:hypothetical protein [Vallitalea longa]GKX29119.1 hypothetical protein SH1V18_15990 [Vallitalea longa]
MKSKYEYIMCNLNMISRLALMKNEEIIQKSIDELIEIIRYKEHTEDEIYILQREIDIVKMMINLYKIKRGNMFRAIIKTSYPDARVYIPKGMVVCFVENVFTHAFYGNKEIWELKLIVESAQDYCDIIIQDNGVGFETAKLDEDSNNYRSINNMICKVTKIGEITVKSTPCIGTKISIHLPI